MLTALLDGERIYAGCAARGPDYACPGCRRNVILRKGQIRIHHFAHEPGQSCAWGEGETEDHLEAKSKLYEAFVNRSLRAEAEWEVPSLGGDRRADVFIWEMAAGPVALELQHTPILPEAMVTRTKAYMAAGVAPIWIPFVDLPEGISSIIENYRPKPFERWISASGFGEIWYWSPRHAALFKGTLEPSMTWRKGHVWEDAHGFREEVPGQFVKQEGVMTLRLEGPYDPSTIGLRRFWRKPARFGRYDLPGGPAASFQMQGKRL
jgi:Competence protein CoiA-like family